LTLLQFHVVKLYIASAKLHHDNLIRLTAKTVVKTEQPDLDSSSAMIFPERPGRSEPVKELPGFVPSEIFLISA
jgi:hypothetical protein